MTCFLSPKGDRAGVAFSCILLHFLAHSCTPLCGVDKSAYLCILKTTKKTIIQKRNSMKKYFTNNITLFLLLALLLAGAALYVAVKNRRQLRALPTGCALWTQEEKDKVMQVCDVQNTNTSPNNE